MLSHKHSLVSNIIWVNLFLQILEGNPYFKKLELFLSITMRTKAIG